MDNRVFSKKNVFLACIVALLLIALFARNSNNKPGSEMAETTQAPELVTVKVTVDFVSNLIFSKYDVDFIVNGKVLKTLSHGTDATFSIQTEKGTKDIVFSKHKDTSVKGDGSFIVTCDTEIAYKIACYNDKVTVEVLYIDPNEVQAGKAKINGKASDFVNKDYKDVIKTLKALGFTNIIEKPLYDIIWGITTSGSVEEVSIDGSKTYKRGNIFNEDVEVIVSYHLPTEEDPAKQTTEVPTEPQKTEAVTTEAPTSPPTTIDLTTEALIEPSTTELSTNPPTTEAPTDPTTEAPTTQEPTEPTTAKKSWPSHSSGDRKTAKKGNSGVYAYVKSGRNYDIYYIIDFEQGYVYYFLYGPNDKYSADRVKIVQGDLNSLVLITYHDGGSEWSYGLCFPWANQPDTLIVQDEYGFKDQFEPTDLEEALKIRDTLKIIDY